MHARQHDSAEVASPSGVISRRCVSPGCRRDAETGVRQPRLAAARSLLCGHCRDRFDQQLRTLPELYVELEQSRVNGRRTPGIPLRPRTVELRASIRNVLASWAQLVVAERRVARPIRNVAGMAAFLHKHVDWLGVHPAIAEISSEIGDLVMAAAALVHSDTSLRVTVAKCSAPDCTGDLVAWLRQNEATVPAEITCTHSREHAWPAHRWSNLRRYLDARPERDSA